MIFDGILKIVRGVVKLRGGTDGNVIGNLGDRLNVNAQITGGSSRPAKSKIYEFSGSQALVTILTPDSGKKIDVYSLALTSSDTSGAKIIVRFNTSAQNVYVDWTKTGGSPVQLLNFQGNINEVLSLIVTGLPGNKEGALYLGYDQI